MPEAPKFEDFPLFLKNKKQIRNKDLKTNLIYTIIINLVYVVNFNTDILDFEQNTKYIGLTLMFFCLFVTTILKLQSDSKDFSFL